MGGRQLTDEECDDAGDEEVAGAVSLHAGAWHQSKGDELEHEGEGHEGLHGDEPRYNERHAPCTACTADSD